MTHPMLERITKIHKKISSGCYPNSKELAYDLETSVSSISRDVEFMRTRMNAPIAYNKKNNGYFYKKKYEMPCYIISEKDGETLAAANLLLSYFKNTPVYEEARTVINLLSEGVIENGVSPLLDRIALAPSAKAIIDTNVWTTLCNAMRDNFVIEFDYRGRWNTENEHRTVRPYQIILDNGSCFLFGYAEERESERLYSVSRIQNLQITEKVFTLPENFNFESRCGGGRFGAFKGCEVERCSIKFFNEARSIVKDSFWADDQKIIDNQVEDSTTITFTSTQTYKVLEWILSQGQNAVPLEPEWLVQEWKDHIKAMEKYL